MKAQRKTITMRRPSPTPRCAVPQRRADRQAVAMAIVLAVMILATALIATWARTVIDAHRQQRLEQRRHQVEWLVESGIERAVAQLSRADDYRGETWQVTADELGGRDAAVVVIRVEPVADNAMRRIVHVRADYPEESDRRVRHSKQIMVALDKLTGRDPKDEVSTSNTPVAQEGYEPITQPNLHSFRLSLDISVH